MCNSIQIIDRIKKLTAADFKQDESKVTGFHMKNNLRLTSLP